MSSAVVMTRLFAWYPRWAVIRFVNSWARSTFDISTAPVVSEPKPWAESPGVDTSAGPELFETENRLPPSRFRPWSFANFASVTYVVVVTGGVPGVMTVTAPFGSIDTDVAFAGMLIFVRV